MRPITKPERLCKQSWANAALAFFGHDQPLGKRHVGRRHMNRFAALAGLALLCTTAVSAEARDRWRYGDHTPWHSGNMIIFEDEDAAWYDDEGDVVIVRPRASQHRQVLRDADEEDLWWLDDGARQKLEERSKVRKLPTQKPLVKKATVAKPAPVPTPRLKPELVSAVAAAKPVTVAKVEAPDVIVTKSDPVVTASLVTPKLDEQPKAKPVISKPVVAKPVVAKPAPGKTIGCTAGAAVIVGYGFAEVKPKACTGDAYAYTATRAGKNYEIKLTAASGEITDVKKAQ
jgi:hypothetical protein